MAQYGALVRDATPTMALLQIAEKEVNLLCISGTMVLEVRYIKVIINFNENVGKTRGNSECPFLFLFPFSELFGRRYDILGK